MDPDQIERILKEHIRLCTDLHELFIEEGKIMRATGSPPDEAFLKKKQEFLPALDRGLELLQRINEDPTAFDRSVAPLVVVDQVARLPEPRLRTIAVFLGHSHQRRKVGRRR